MAVPADLLMSAFAECDCGSGECDGRPLTSEPAPVDDVPLTSEPPLAVVRTLTSEPAPAGEPPLTSEPPAAAGPEN